MRQVIPQGIKDRLIARWGNYESVVEIKNDVVHIGGALKIGEPTQLLNDLKTSGFMPCGRAFRTLRDGTKLIENWQYSQMRADEIRQAGEDETRYLGIPADFTGDD